MATDDDGDTPAWLSGPAQAPLTASEAGGGGGGGHGASQGIWAEQDDGSLLSCCNAQVPTTGTIRLWSTFCGILCLGLFVFSFCGDNYRDHGTGGRTVISCSTDKSGSQPPFAVFCPAGSFAGASGQLQNSTLLLSCGYTSGQLGWRMACICFTLAFLGVLNWALKNSKDNLRFVLNVACLGLAVCTFIAMCVDSSAVRGGRIGGGTHNCGKNAQGGYVDGVYEKGSFVGICAWDAINSIALFYLTFLLFRFRKSDRYSDI